MPVSNTLVYSLAGEDAALFQVDTVTGVVTYQPWFTPSYDEVWDLDRDHVYEMAVIGSDDNGVEVSRSDLELVVSPTDAIWQNAATADPGGSIVYSLTGDDADLFQVDTVTGVVTYQPWFTPSYDEVWDLDRDHIYEMTVIGSDSNGVEVSRSDVELVVSPTDAVWQDANGSDPADPVDPDNALDYSLTGDDADLFQVDTATGAVTYQPWFTPSYDEVWDLDRDHIYEMTVIGSDSNGSEISRSDLELVVSQSDAVWQEADTSDPVDPVEPGNTVVYSLTGDDAALFQVDSATGAVTYQSWFTPSYDEVWDLDRDHIYEMTVIGQDGNGLEVSRSDLELVVSPTDAIWQNADGSEPVEPVDPVEPTASVVDIVRHATDPSETLYGIRDDTSSRGIDLDGALITATYADGSVENLTWRALDAYTNGGATGANIDMFYGWSQHELSVSKHLASLQIDLKPAGSVFDTTVTLDDDPLGGSTPGSSFGYTFEFLGGSADTGGNVTVTYSGIVNLVGRPADGDLFTTMLVDFSDLSGGGILGDVDWNTDIDTLRYAGDLMQAGTNAALAGNDVLTGTVDGDFLNGSGGEDTLIGLSGNDILNGGAGADEFVFADGSGDDVIVDFDTSGGDVMDIHDFGFADFSAVLAASSDVGADTVIQLDADDSITLIDVSMGDLTIDDFWM